MEITEVYKEAIKLLATNDFFHTLVLTFGLAVVGAYSLLELWKWVRRGDNE